MPNQQSFLYNSIAERKEESTIKRIMLDAGHYGNYNQSPVVPIYWESRRMWVLCEYLAAELQKYGFEVLKTRDDIEKDIDVYYRGKMAKNCDLFISLHSNAADSEAVDRVDVYAAYDNLNDSHELAARFSKSIAELMGVSEGSVKTRIGDNGDEYYGVLRGARHSGCPLFYIIEHSFHTNEKATLWLLEDKNLLALAKLEAAIIASYYGIDAEPILGDVNDNGVLDMTDLILIKRAYFGSFTLTEEQQKRADFNQNGKIDMLDYILAKRKYFGN